MNKKNQKNRYSITAEESALFRESIGSVTPMKQSRVSHPKPRIRSHHRQQYPRYQYHPEQIERNDTHYSDKSLKRSVKKGQIPIDGQLDLHGKTRLQAEDALKQFLQQAIYMDIHCLLIIHGKGLNSDGNIPVLKELTHYTLSQNPKIAFYTAAAAKHGGSGATYVILKQNSD